MLAQVLAKVLCPCVSVRLSVTSRSSIETAELIELAFGTGTSSQPYYTALKGNSGTSFWNFVPNSELYFALALWRRVINLAGQGGRSARDKLINWTVVGHLCWQTISPSFKARPLVNYSNHQAPSTARFRRAGLSATAGSLLVDVSSRLYLEQHYRTIHISL